MCAAINDCGFSIKSFTPGNCEKKMTVIRWRLQPKRSVVYIIKCSKSRYLFFTVLLFKYIPYILYLFFSFTAVLYLRLYDSFHIFCIYLFKCKNVISFHILSTPNPPLFLTCIQPVYSIHVHWFNVKHGHCLIHTKKKVSCARPQSRPLLHIFLLGLGFCPIRQTEEEVPWEGI